MDGSEQWLPAVGFEGFYEVSDLGRVRTVGRTVTAGARAWLIPGKIRKPVNNGDGRQMVKLWVGGQGTMKLIHRMVLEAFVGPCPEGMECLHGDDDFTNNRLSNLRWDTHATNQQEMAARGRSPAGERNGQAKLTDLQVADIRAGLRAGRSGVSIAREYGVSIAQVSRIKNGHQRKVRPTQRATGR